MTALTCAIGVTAYNEEANIGPLLERLLTQQLESVRIAEIVVVASGCTDNTEAIAAGYAAQHEQVRLLVQPGREGKASAINLFLAETTAELLLLSSADLQPAPDVVERLIAPFADPEMGMTTGRPVPVNPRDTFLGYGVHLLWDLHHDINERSFKAGELIAFRRVFRRIPHHTAVDEASMEPLIRGQGYAVKYIPEAIVYNKGAETTADFLRQRRRIYAGHLAMRDDLGYAVSTMGGGFILRLLLARLEWRPRPFLWAWGIVGLEVWGRLLGWWDYRRKRDHAVWEIATSTKKLNSAGS